MATKSKTTDLLATWDETVVTVHMSVGKFRKMDEIYRENRELVKQVSELKVEISKKAEKQAPAVVAGTGNEETEKLREMLTFVCEGILASLDVANGIVIKDPATALCLFTEARSWLIEHDNKASIIYDSDRQEV